MWRNMLPSNILTFSYSSSFGESFSSQEENHLPFFWVHSQAIGLSAGPGDHCSHILAQEVPDLLPGGHGASHI
jgi:hypothetical protein